MKSLMNSDWKEKLMQTKRERVTVKLEPNHIKAAETVLSKGDRVEDTTKYTNRKVNFEGKWYCCPYCKKKLFLLHEKTIVRNLPYRCKACKHDIEVNI